ncbi:hypothetical protein CYY_003148 [Polysphondylium violaceum]|uniref:Rho-GAP domain-containing protein n=1 Tax=Polysphondylium violaceum TaxID=133409 RepID=A0A8J4PYX9_9MYCE|nr:hypothetical protein CYY_003148 [Polysphondylium violaceum]
MIKLSSEKVTLLAFCIFTFILFTVQNMAIDENNNSSNNNNNNNNGDKNSDSGGSNENVNHISISQHREKDFKENSNSKNDEEGERVEEEEEDEEEQEQEEEQEEEQDREEEEDDQEEEEEEQEQEQEEEEIGMFGVDVVKLMELQKDEDYDIDQEDQDEEVPMILTFLLDRIKDLNGFQTEGIFRIPGNLKVVETLANEGFNPEDEDLDQSAHVWSSLLKKWIRDLPEPLFSEDIIAKIQTNTVDYEFDIDNVLQSIHPPVYRYILKKIGLFFGELIQDEHYSLTKMNQDNLSVILAPTLFKIIPSANATSSAFLLDVLKNQKKEIAFVKSFLLYFKQQFINDNN